MYKIYRLFNPIETHFISIITQTFDTMPSILVEPKEKMNYPCLRWAHIAFCKKLLKCVSSKNIGTQMRKNYSFSVHFSW